MVDEITQQFFVSSKSQRQWQKLCRCVLLQNIPGPTFLALRHTEPNSSNQSLNNVFITFNVYSLFLGHTFATNGAFSIKNCCPQRFHPRFLHSYFLRFQFLWTQTSPTLDVLFLDHRRNTNFLRPLLSFFKHFCHHLKKGR
jgi:hypothetical protein